MLRLLVAVLVLANAGFYAWTQGLLDDVVGARAQGDREPERMARQVRPESIRVEPVVAAVSPAVAASAREAVAMCLEAGPFSTEQMVAATAVLQTSLPADSWRDVKTERPGVWLVYMGKYPNREQLQKKFDELKRLKVTYEEVHGTSELEGGLSLGRFDTEAAAGQSLADFTRRGVRTARVVALTRPSTQHSLRVESANASLQAKLSALNAAGLQGKSFAPCARG
ncbi:MAG TPA: hypothetical protein VE029_04505 [Rhizobacter sp.]|nr:hypothetical protein [Rhizobacter sp.]